MPVKTSSMLFFLKPFLEFCFLTPALCSIILLNTCSTCLLIYWTLLNTSKAENDDLPAPLARSLFLVMPFSLASSLYLVMPFWLENLNMQSSWRYWSSTCCWQFSIVKHFQWKRTTNPKKTIILPAAFVSAPSEDPPQHISITQFFFEASSSIFVWANPSQSMAQKFQNCLFLNLLFDCIGLLHGHRWCCMLFLELKPGPVLSFP